MPEHTSELDQRYEILRELGRGGMGQVFVARHRELGTLVAIKRMVGEDDDPEGVLRFRREAKLVASLRSPHIVKVFDSGIDSLGPYMVMELLEGEDLATRIAREGPLSEQEATSILAQTARGLECAHEAGLLHRDVKPANIFLTREPGHTAPVVKLLDFGIAKPIRSGAGMTTITSDGALIGSPAYMSPEQVWGQTLDVRTDLWALCAVTYEMLLAGPPFVAETAGDTLACICSGNYAPPRKTNPGLKAWDAFFARGFSVRREGRFASAAAVAEAARRIVGAPPPSMLAASTQSLAQAFGLDREPSIPNDPQVRRARGVLFLGIGALALATLVTLAVVWPSRQIEPDRALAPSLPEPTLQTLPAGSSQAKSEPEEPRLPKEETPSTPVEPNSVKAAPPPKVTKVRTRPTSSQNQTRPEAPAPARPGPKASTRAGTRDPFTGLIQTP